MVPTHMRFRFPIIILILLVSDVLIGCQFWSAVPVARYGASMVFDPVESQVILFGGRAQGLFGEKYFNDLWVLDSDTKTWTSLKTSDPPAPRLSPGMVYDPVYHQIILFGGLSKHGRLGDTWVYAISENQWLEVSPRTSPSPRSDTGMVYDELNQVVELFGGYCQEEDRDLCDDTWSYDPKSNTWTEMKPLSSPPIMYGFSLDYDATSYQSILWGGHLSTFEHGNIVSAGYGDNIWIYEYPQDAWREIVGNDKPPARYWHQASFITPTGKLLIFGGDGGRSYLNDTWLYDNRHNTWERVNPVQAPAPRVNATMTYDSANNVIILFGGLGEDRVDLQDTWIFDVSGSEGEWRKIASP